MKCFAEIIQPRSTKREGSSCPLHSSCRRTLPASPISTSPAWEKRERQLIEFSTLDDAVQKYLNLTSYYGQQVEIDNQARVLLPQILRDSAKLDAEVTVFGKLLYLEVNNREAFEKKLPELELTAEDRKALAAILSPKS